MNYFLWSLVYLFSRYFHIVSATFLVGGTLFYEMVVPIAIDDLRVEQQLLILARARLVFKSIVWTSAALIIASGIISTQIHWPEYSQDRYYHVEGSALSNAKSPVMEVSPAGRAGWWWAAHASTGVIAVLIAVGLTIGKTPPTQPIRWMRLNLIILLLVMFFASVTRHVRLQSGPQAEPMDTSLPHSR